MSAWDFNCKFQLHSLQELELAQESALHRFLIELIVHRQNYRFPAVVILNCFMMQVVCKDFPRPELESAVNFLEAAQMSASFRGSPHPKKGLEVVIAGAGD